MDNLDSLFANLAGALAAALPSRVISRNLLDFGQRADADLLLGVVTVVSAGEDSYAQHLGRIAEEGTVHALLVGQLRVAEANPPTPEAVERAEFALMADLKAALRGAAIPGAAVLLQRFRQSQQLEYPYGWIAAELDILT